MTNLVNYTPILTLDPRPTKNVFVKLDGQAFVRATPAPEPVLGLRRHRPLSGQIWPRQEAPQRDKLGIV